MKLVMKSFVALMLVLSLCLGNFSGIFAMAATKFENGNTWYGDDVKVDVTAGTDAYNYMVLFKKPVHGYEFAGHFIGEGEGAQTFVVIDTAAHDGTTWIPNGLYELGKSNYDVLYCCDVETMVKNGTYYKRVNLENSEYYTEAEADMIRAIVTNAYPYVSMEEMKAALAEAGFAYANELTRSEIISAVQAAIWASANEVTAEDLRYNKSYRVTDNYGWGQPMHDISDEAGYGVTGNRKFETYPEVGVRHDALVDYLLALEPVKANDTQIVITELDIVKSQIEGTEGQYDVNLNVELNYGADADDEVVLNVYVNGECVEEVKVNNEKNYSMNLKAMENDQIKVTVSGTQNLERGVYFYAPEPADVNGDGIATSREVSQNLVGVSMGATPVYAESVVKIHNGVLTADKTAEKVGDERFDVSIEVPGGDAEKIHDEIILMVDGSYSMDNEWPAMKEAIVAIGEAVLDGSGHTQLTLMAFGMGDNEVLVHVKTVAELSAALGELPGNLLYGRSSTNCEAGFTGVAEYITNHDETLGNVEVIFISDGNINTDETPRAFDANWQTWTKFGALTVAQAAFEGALVNGKNLPAAFSVFGDRFAGMTNEQILNAVFVDKTVAITDAEYLAYAEQLWTDVYAYSGLTRGEAYPVSDAERAFVKYDKENGTYIQDLFYYTTYKSAYVTYNDRWTRTPAAALELANMEQVKHLYVVDYDGKSAWMELGHEKSDFILSSGIAGLVEALQETLTALSKTPFNDVVVTDYMSKWVILDPTTIRVVDGNGNLIAMFDEENSPKDADGNHTAYLYKWVGKALCANKAPIVLDLIPESEYAAGGADVIGNADGEIYRITWNLKDGPLMRNEAFALQYQVIINTEEPGFEYNKDYPANGNTFAEYKDEDGKDNKTDIKVPEIVTDRILTEVSGTKTWDDNNDQDGKRPESITVRLYANGVEVASMSVTEEMGWTYKFANLTKYANGVEIVYTITEDAVEGYTTVINGFEITNTYKPEETQVTVNKVWNDANNQDGKRPGSITVTLLANGEKVTTQDITAEMGWTYTFENLPVYANGQKIVYTITEAAVEGYTTVINGFEITNTYKPEETQITVNKVWNDANNQDGKRPGSITVTLLANGEKVTTQDITAEMGWTYTFENLPVYANGQKIVYTITEAAVEGYTTVINGFEITNTYKPEETQITVNKVWNDANNQDGKRPGSITVTLLANGEKVTTQEITAEMGWTYTFENLPVYANGQKIEYTVIEAAVEGYTTVINGFEITNTYKPEETQVTVNKVWNDANNQDGKRPGSITVTLLANGEKVTTQDITAEMGWTYTFENLPVYANGQKIEYTIIEAAVEGYTTVINGFEITNTYKPEETQITVNKVWNDANNQDGKRPGSITVTLLANGEKVTTQEITAEMGWTYTFENLPVYANGQKIEYTVIEAAVEGYTTVINGFEITNTYKPEETQVTVNKVWNDANNQDGKRPGSITVTLLANGEKVTTQDITAEMGWTYTFENLPVYANGQKIVYTITEAAVEGYTTVINGFEITNTYKPEETQITVNKVWNDANNQDGKRPGSITVTLLANGEKVTTQEITAEMGWTYTFENLPVYANGQKIEYTVIEAAVEGYTTVINGFEITNTYKPEETQITVNKVWNDANNQDGKRPGSITVTLLANGEKVTTQDITAEMGWTYTFENLPVYANGQKIVYTITEAAVEGYTTVINGFEITNTYKPEETQITVNKVWNDANNQDGKRPGSITVTLLANGEKVTTQEITAEMGWTYTFENLPVYANGQKIEYTVIEAAVEGYTTVINGFEITNTYKPEETQITVNKVWNDANNQDGKRPGSITVTLLANGEKVTTQDITAEMGWTYTFENLPVYANGQKIVYTITEAAVEGYTTVINGFEITNTYKPEETQITVNKVWNDANNQDGKRPGSITVTLLANGEKVTTQEITAEMGWTYTFENLPVYANGQKIEYTVIEAAVEGYTTVINGFEITNTYKPEETQVTVNKVWNDANNQDGKRPGSITVTLLANGQKVTTQDITAEMGWTYTFENLPVYANGQKIVYTITEAAVEGYTTVINGFEITNTYKPEETQVVVNKVWDDDDDFEGKRPGEITIRLYANGVEILAQKVTANDNWTFTFMNLPVYANGQKIVYTISEDAVSEYTTLGIEGNAETGFTVTNQYLIEVPEEDPPLIDKTGDDIGMAMMAAMVALMGAAVCVWNRKKDNA